MVGLELLVIDERTGSPTSRRSSAGTTRTTTSREATTGFGRRRSRRIRRSSTRGSFAHLRQRQRGRPLGRRDRDQAERRAVRGTRPRTRWCVVDLESGETADGSYRPSSDTPDPPRALPALRVDRRHRPHALAVRDGVGPGEPRDPVLRHDARGPLLRSRPRHPIADDATRSPGAYEEKTGDVIVETIEGSGSTRSRCRRRSSPRTGRSPGEPTRPRRRRTRSRSRRSRRCADADCFCSTRKRSRSATTCSSPLPAQARARRVLRPGHCTVKVLRLHAPGDLRLARRGRARARGRARCCCASRRSGCAARTVTGSTRVGSATPCSREPLVLGHEFAGDGRVGPAGGRAGRRRSGDPVRGLRDRAVPGPAGTSAWRRRVRRHGSSPTARCARCSPGRSGSLDRFPDSLSDAGSGRSSSRSASPCTRVDLGHVRSRRACRQSFGCGPIGLLIVRRCSA